MFRWFRRKPEAGRIAYVLDAPELCGGVKVVFQHAELLRRRGFDVTVFGRGPRPAWVRFGGRYVDYSNRPLKSEPPDLAIATYWTTLPTAERLGGQLVHFCQGFEGDLGHLAADVPNIEAAYTHELPTFVVTPYLAERLSRRFGRDCFVVPPPTDDQFSPPPSPKPNVTARIVVYGIFECDVKRIRVALEAVKLLRASGVECRLLRVSALPLSDTERAILEPDEYLCRVAPAKVADRLRKCDLLLFPSAAGEGFGLPVIEAMASGVPVVASRIPSTEFMGGGALMLVPPDDPSAMSEAAAVLLSDADLRRDATQRGLAAVERFRPDRVANQLVEAVAWARLRKYEV